MKNLINFFKSHRVFTMLMAIVLVCAIVICTVLIKCFYINGEDKYGDRLNGISEYEIADSRLADYKNNLTNNEKVKVADIYIQGKIIYITLQLNEKTDLEEAKSIALKSLENFSEKELGFYDINVTMKENSTNTSEGFIISGYKNKRSTTIVWNNNRPVNSSETADPNVTEVG